MKLHDNAQLQASKILQRMQLSDGRTLAFDDHGMADGERFVAMLRETLRQGARPLQQDVVKGTQRYAGPGMVHDLKPLGVMPDIGDCT